MWTADTLGPVQESGEIQSQKSRRLKEGRVDNFRLHFLNPRPSVISD